MEIIPIKTRRIEEGDSLTGVLLQAIKHQHLKLQNGDIILVVSKVVALTEGRIVKLNGAKRSSAIIKRYGVYRDSSDFIKMVRNEADIFFEDEMFLSVKNGIFTPSAGIDTSNIPDGYALGWPLDAYKSAAKFRNEIMAKTNRNITQKGKTTKALHTLKNIGVEIFDSFILPLREGVTGISLGYSGFHGIEDCRGKHDLYGKKLRVTRRNIADGLAAAATLVCGEASEMIPFVIARFGDAHAIRPGRIGADIHWTGKKISPTEIRRSAATCLYRTIYPSELF